MNSSVFRFCTLTALAAFFLVQVPPAYAALITTDQLGSQQQVQSDREKVKAFYDRAGVQAKLLALGVQAGVAKDRVDALTDQEVAMMAQRIDSLPAGGNLSQTDIIIILLIAILVAIAI